MVRNQDGARDVERVIVIARQGIHVSVCTQRFAHLNRPLGFSVPLSESRKL